MSKPMNLFVNWQFISLLFEFINRFDTEHAKHQEEIRDEKMLREKLQRERDGLISQKYSLEQDLQVHV